MCVCVCSQSWNSSSFCLFSSSSLFSIASARHSKLLLLHFFASFLAFKTSSRSFLFFKIFWRQRQGFLSPLVEHLQGAPPLVRAAAPPALGGGAAAAAGDHGAAAAVVDGAAATAGAAEEAVERGRGPLYAAAPAVAAAALDVVVVVLGVVGEQQALVERGGGGVPQPAGQKESPPLPLDPV